MRLNGCRVDPVIISVCADKADENEAGVLVNLDDETVAIAFDVKYHAIAGQNISRAIALLNVLEGLPVRS